MTIKQMKMAFDNEYTIIKKRNENNAIQDSHENWVYTTLNIVSEIRDRLIQIEEDYMKYKMYEQWHPFPTVKDLWKVWQLPSEEPRNLSQNKSSIT